MYTFALIIEIERGRKRGNLHGSRHHIRTLMCGCFLKKNLRGSRRHSRKSKRSSSPTTSPLFDSRTRSQPACVRVCEGEGGQGMSTRVGRKEGK